MNELLQKHGCSNVFTVPEGLRELMGDISREVLREQPTKIFEYIANYLSVLLITREHGVMAVKILDDLCDCKPSVSEHLLQLGFERSEAETLSQTIKEEVEEFEPIEGKEKVKEMQILKKILGRVTMDEDMSAKVCQVARNAYRDYWYRKKMMEKSMKVSPDEPWEIAAQHTLELYKRTKPSYDEITRATQKIQAAYKGYHVRRNLLNHLKPKPKKARPKVDIPGPPIDVAGSREIFLGPVIDIKVREDDMTVMFVDIVGQKLGLQYNPMRTLTHVDDQEESFPAESRISHIMTGRKSLASHSQVKSVAEIVSKPSQIGPMPSRMEGVRQSRSEGAPQQSRLLSQMPDSAAVSLQRISFAAVPVEVLSDLAAEDEIPEEPAQEIPEDIPDDRTDGDGESVQTASAPSSAPTTDVEEVEDLTTDDGE